MLSGGLADMLKHQSVGRVALVSATVLGVCHLCWSMLVALGWAQPVIDFVFWAHFIKPIYVIEPFELARAVVLVALTAGVGFALGLVFALIWNALHRT
jgi:hypothetical protein